MNPDSENNQDIIIYTPMITEELHRNTLENQEMHC